MRYLYAAISILCCQFLSAAPSSHSFLKAAETMAPAIVTIRAEKEAAPLPEPLTEEGCDRFFEEVVFADLVGVNGNDNLARSIENLQNGTGILISSDGYIMANTQFVRRAKQIVVTLNDGKEAVPQIITSDGYSNIAILKIEGNNLPFFPLPDSRIKKVVSALLERRDAIYAYLGIMLGPVNHEGKGAKIYRVTQDSPADDGELLKHDVILECNGKPLTTASAFIKEIGLQEPGTPITLTIKRKIEGWWKTEEVILKKEIILGSSRKWPGDSFFLVRS